VDSVTVGDWGEEIFAEGVGAKLKNWATPARTLYRSSI